jgi:indolepyruvate ferredoxin oxidoreductase beta subunit
MTKDMILAGVGGQGVLSIAYCLCNAAVKRGLKFKQSEVHGMAQRGGAVVSHLRISPDPIYSDLVAAGSADLLLSIEPLESLRYVHLLASSGSVVTSSSPVVNIPDYPNVNEVLDKVAEFSEHVIVDSKHLATVAGSGRAANMVMLGAGGWRVGFSMAELEVHVRALFANKTERVVKANCGALQLGRYAAKLYVQNRSSGKPYAEILEDIARIAPAELAEQAAADLAHDPQETDQAVAARR